MTLYVGMPAKIRLDARTQQGQRLNVDTIVNAEYTLLYNGVEFLRKTLNNGITIQTDDSGTGFLYVQFNGGELSIAGEFKQYLSVSDCSGGIASINIRPLSIYVEGSLNFSVTSTLSSSAPSGGGGGAAPSASYSTFSAADQSGFTLVGDTSTDAAHKVKSIKQGSGVSITSDGSSLTISSTGGGSGTDDHSLLINRNLADQHAISSITGLQSAIDLKISSSEKGAANGVAPLAADSKIAAAYLPSYVDDVLEFANLAAFPATGATGVIYIAIDTNKVYRWSGTVYTEISPSPGSTDAVTEGATNLYFTDARARTAAVQDLIADGVTNIAPSQNSVFDALAGKAALVHTHVIADVTGLQTALDGKQSTITVSTTAPASPVLNQLWLDIT